MALGYAGYVLGLPAYRTIGAQPLLLAPPLLSRGMNALAVGASVAAAGVIGAPFFFWILLRRAQGFNP